MKRRPEQPFDAIEIGGKELVVARAGEGWVVRYDDRELLGRSVVPLLEELFGRDDRQTLRVALDALIREAADRSTAGRPR